MKICMVGSSGGHLAQMYFLKPFWGKEDRFWVTFPKEDAKGLLRGERVYPCAFPTNRNLKALVRNTVLAWKILKKEKPDVIISTGAAVSVPFFYVGKILKIKLVYVEIIDRTEKLTLSGRMVYPIADRFIVQWKTLQKNYPKSIYLGSIF